ncbi:MAG: hypothetical protein WBZ35_18730, partial [Pseudolabrys sp.]
MGDETARARIDDAKGAQCKQRHRPNRLASIFSVRRQWSEQPLEQSADDGRRGDPDILVRQMALCDRR